MGTSYYRVVSWELNFLKSFFYKIFFWAQLVSAQRLSALFPLRNFCSVSFFDFALLGMFAGNYCLIKTGIMKIYEIGLCSIFFETLWKILLFCMPVFKKYYL